MQSCRSILHRLKQPEMYQTGTCITLKDNRYAVENMSWPLICAPQAKL